MSTGVDQLKLFVEKVSSDIHYLPEKCEFEIVCTLLKNSNAISNDLKTNILRCLSYYTIDDRLDPEISNKCQEVIKDLLNDYHLEILINHLREILLNIKNLQSSVSGRYRIVNHNEIGKGLKPQLGFSAKEDLIRETWRKDGGLRSIPLFYTILSFLNQKHISQNLWWITPGILNLLDDTSDIQGIKLKGVLILRQFLDVTLHPKTSLHFNFHSTCLIQAYEPILKNMCFYLPPSYQEKESLSILQVVYPTLLSLYFTDSGPDSSEYFIYIGKFFSETILQTTIPRIGLDHVDLLLFVLEFTIKVIKILTYRSVKYMQRVIYTVGEYIIKNPFIKLHVPLLLKTLEVLKCLIINSPDERVKIHKYDFLACALILFKKLHNEDALNDEILALFQDYVLLLENNGCNLASDKEKLLQYKELDILFK